MIHKWYIVASTLSARNLAANNNNNNKKERKTKKIAKRNENVVLELDERDSTILEY